MYDQASTLRIMASNTAPIEVSAEKQHLHTINSGRKLNGTRCVAVTGGKGGIGKSNLAVNLSLELGALGNRVTLLDADFGLANADILCGLAPKFHLGHVFAGVKGLDEVVVNISEKVSLIPGGSGIEDLANLSGNAREYIFAELQLMEENADFMVIDTAAGIAENVLGVLLAASEVVIVATPEPTCLVDAYATIKVILRHAPGKQISLVVNNFVGVAEAKQVYQQLNSAVYCFLSSQIEFLGMIPHDAMLAEAVREQVPVVQYAPDCPASRAIRLVAKQFQQQKQKDRDARLQLQSFWETLAGS